VGSDVYDTLLILQALRPRLPDVVFFTTDLDARYSDPRELEWSRNLVIFSGYGLSLRDELQNGVAPFRDSTQGAQFLATLNALNDTNVSGADKIQPRRFEIGRRGPVNLSITDGGVHPPIRWPLGSLWSWLAAVLGIVATASLVLWKRARQMAFPSDEYRSQPLAVAEEDLGGMEGVRRIVRNLETRRADDKDNLAAWLLSEPQSPRATSEAIVARDIKDFQSFLAKLKEPPDALWRHLRSKIPALHRRVDLYTAGQPVSDSLQTDLVRELERILQSPERIFDAEHFSPHDRRRPETQALFTQNPEGAARGRLNRMLLEDACPCELAQRADEEWLQQQSKSLIAKFNALVFGTPCRGSDGLPVAQGGLGLTWVASDVNGHGRRQLSAAKARQNREAVNEMLTQLGSAPPPESKHGVEPHSDSVSDSDSASQCARGIALVQYERRKRRLVWFWITAPLLTVGSLAWAWLAKHDTFGTLTGEPFNLVGTSAWPAEFIRWSVLAFSVLIIIRTQLRLSEAILQITRRYRLETNPSRSWRERWLFKLPEPPRAEHDVDANELWTNYQRIRHWFPRLLRISICIGFYLLFGSALFQLTTPPFSPVRGYTLLSLDKPLLLFSVLAFLAVTFWIIDAACCCAWFIRRLSQAPTRYRPATLNHFTRQRAIDDPALVEEWIDLQLIADLTEPVGRLVYWPFVAVMLLVIARNPWWDHWSWHWPMLVIYALNLILAAASSIILQNAARDARKTGLQRLKAKFHDKHRKASTVEEHESEQAESLLEEIKDLRRGAFAPLSKNPLVGALLVNSSGVVILDLVARLYFK